MEDQNQPTYDKNLYREGSLDAVEQVLFPARTGDPAKTEVNINNMASGVDSSVSEQAVGAVQAGKAKFDNTQAGYILGTDKGMAKFYIGDTTNYFNWTGSAIVISGSITATSGFFGSATNGIQINSSGLQIIGTGYIATGVTPNERIVMQKDATFGHGIEGYDSSNNLQWALNTSSDPYWRVFMRGGNKFLTLTNSTSTTSTGAGITMTSVGNEDYFIAAVSGSAARAIKGGFKVSSDADHGAGFYFASSNTAWDGAAVYIQASTARKADALFILSNGFSNTLNSRITNNGYLGFPSYWHRSEFDELPAALASTVIANAHWVGAGTSGTQTIRTEGADFSDDDVTYVQLSTTATGSRTSTMTFRRSSQMANHTSLEMLVHHGTGLTTTKSQWGWMSDATHYAVFTFDTDVNAANIYFETNNGAGATQTDTGIDVASGQFRRYRIITFPGLQVFAYIDDTLVYSNTSISLASLMKPFFYVDNKATGVERVLNIDYVEIWHGRDLNP